ncbi:mechanosensitive ion channel protein MscS [Flavobacterium sp. 316]|uniref:Mechanosensitive ion channel family protein n=1 Tax=Flavobacterium sediminilitoris TaxID=2024526 RepID=A0ABY4HKC8_9FLAO|nr:MULTISPECIES: mechanosensitive ion channel domain-containing protein [Flavobacterium]KIX22782.1 mechanosensitive ion channel protein MscS [Flavobacterium sp. 316]UOX33314.1 mechanosensitive ion channel family protein [Flavobacterium sediminilitoris]
MLKFIENPYLHQEILTFIAICIFFILKLFSSEVVKKFARVNESLEHRTNLVIKYINILLGLLAIFSIIIIWGVEKEQIFIFVSSVFAVVGVASFAQWSILSNISAGIILFFSYPFKIGDKIKILDKDYPLEGEIEDIKAFYIILKTSDDEQITYPNNLLMQKGILIVKSNFEDQEFTD